MIKIEKKITAVAVGSKGIQQTAADIDPLYSRIERRPDAPLNAIIEKITLSSGQGKKSLYIAVSFVEVSGIMNGKEVRIERPIEVFLPAGQTDDDGQWTVATMRSLSLAARGGYMTRALQDLRKVPWSKGQVRCGEKDWGNGNVKPMFHSSEVAAIAFAIQRILANRGFLDSDGNQIPTEVLAKKFAGNQEKKPGTQTESGSGSSTCPECGGGNLIKVDGCDLCQDCGHSKCS